ncbi:putative YopX domain-containing protein [Tenacibaculum sp. 190524A05c]|uniref:YopX family protein n=1 Tax=Tenacibaculum platacis TaxID=3137852 RepID=UPI0031FAE383
MRDIKVRAWNRIVERMSSATTLKELNTLGTSVQWNNIEIMQSTNMFDLNGVEIFEGDILLFNSTEAHLKPKKIVYYNENKGCYYFGNMSFVELFESGFCQPSNSQSFEVIGNIHQDKDLIKL